MIGYPVQPLIRRLLVVTFAACGMLVPISALATMTIALGNLFDDPAGTPLGTALATDTFNAAGDASDLGVDSVQLGLGSPATLAGGATWTWNFSDASSLAAGSPGNDSFRAGPDQAGIRFDGVFLPVIGTTKFLDGVGLHSNSFITFDLDELRSADGLGSTAPGQFTSDIFGLNDTGLGGSGSSRGDVYLWVIVSNAVAPISASCNGASGTIGGGSGGFSMTGGCGAPAFDQSNQVGTDWEIAFDGDARYLTLGVTQVDSNLFRDHGSFGGAAITFIPEPGTGLLVGWGLFVLAARRRHIKGLRVPSHLYLL